jgi:hypothetical protein
LSIGQFGNANQPQEGEGDGSAHGALCFQIQDAGPV